MSLVYTPQIKGEGELKPYFLGDLFDSSLIPAQGEGDFRCLVIPQSRKHLFPRDELKPATAAANMAVAMNILVNYQDAEDASQEAFLKAFHNFNRFDLKKSFLSFLRWRSSLFLRPRLALPT